MNIRKEAAPEGTATACSFTLPDRADISELYISPLGDAALDYAANGWAVFPCWEFDTPRTRAKSPRIAGGFKNATTDLAQVVEWWDHWPRALIGLALPLDVVVIDLDEPRALADLEQINGEPLPETLTVITGRAGGGYHYYYRHASMNLSQSGVYGPQGKLDGVDVRLGGHGYVVAPPSPHPATGALYEWAGDTIELAMLPAALAAAMAPIAPRPLPLIGLTGCGSEKGLDGLLRKMASAQEGERNPLLFWAACRMTDREKLSATTDWEGLEQAALSTGLPEAEIRRTIASAWREVMEA